MINWRVVEQRVQQLHPELAGQHLQSAALLLAIHKLGADAPRLQALTGYPLAWIHDQLDDLRRSYDLLTKCISEATVLKYLPGASGLMLEVLHSDDVEPPSPTTLAVVPATSTDLEVNPMENCACGKPLRHMGRCKKLSGAGASAASKRKRLVPDADAESPAPAPDLAEVPGCRFLISFEDSESGTKLDLQGASLAAFQDGLDLLARLTGRYA